MPSPFANLPPHLHDVAVGRLLGVPTDQRARVLAQLQHEHPEHAAGLQDLARLLANAGRVLDQAFPYPTDAEVPQFDGYRVLQRLGDGAFGVVYLGEQLEPMPRQVAIKVLRPGAGDRSTLIRFEAERRFLARLRHPNIAQIFDAGLLADGRPWFVMEYVPGVPFTTYCDRLQLTIDARLQLFVRLCHGVQHAHDQRIVHRDLKPTNVLVVDVDGQPQPKVIDFGVARALERPLGDGTPRTEPGRVVGTPGYMSPEQQAGDLDSVDARSDVFSLGAMLYELLTGELPWGKSFTTTDSEPPRPSLRVGSDRNRVTTLAERRSSEPRRLASRLRGDLDWIVLRALERQPARRYASALELAADVLRHLRGEAVSVGPPSLAYRLRKFVRRRRGAVLAGICVLAVAAIGAGVGAHYRDSARSSEQRRIEETLAAVTRLLERAGDRTFAAGPRRISMQREMLRDGLQLSERAMHDQAVTPVQRRLRLRCLLGLARVHLLLCEPSAGRPIAERAVADARALLADGDAASGNESALAQALVQLGRFDADLGDYPLAARALRESADRFEALWAQDAVRHATDLADACAERADVVRRLGDDSEWVALLRRAVNLLVAQATAAPEDVRAADDLLGTQGDLAVALGETGDIAGAHSVMQAAQQLASAPQRVTALARAGFQVTEARWHERRGDWEPALAALAHAAPALVACLSENPEAHQVRLQLARANQQLVRILSGKRDIAAALAAGNECAAALAELPASVHRRTQDSIDMLSSMALRVVELESPAAIRAAAAWSERAIELADGMPDDAPQAARLRMTARMSRAQQLFVRRDFGDIEVWRDLVVRAHAVGDPWNEAYARNVLAKWHIIREELDLARGWNQAAVALVSTLPAGPNDDVARQSILRTAMSIEWQAGQHAAQAAIARSLVGSSDWRIVHAAANGFYRSRALVDPGSAESAQYAAECVAACERTLALAEAARAKPDYGRQRALCAAQQAVRIGMVAADHPRARELRREALATLEKLRGGVQESWWDDEVWVLGNIAAAHDRCTDGDLDAALSHLRAVANPALPALESLELANAWAACQRLAVSKSCTQAAKECEETALEQLLLAIDGGIGRPHVMALAEQRTLATFAGYAEVMSSLDK